MLPNCPATAAEPAADAGTSLFDGESLDGWRQHSGEARYTVEDGAIVGTSVADTGNSFLCTMREYGDFVFTCEFKVDAGLNSGVQFRSQVFEEPIEIDLGDGQTRSVPADRVHGYQCEIDCGDNPGRMWTAGVYDEARRGWLYPGPKGGDGEAFTAQGVRIVKRDGWNTFRIECRGDSIKTYVNGELRADFEDNMTTKGVIALQVHGVGDNPDRVGKQVRWRNLRIRELVER
jgi:hypothetical protein